MVATVNIKSKRLYKRRVEPIKLSKPEQVIASVITIVLHMFILYTLFNVLLFSLHYSAYNDVTSNGMVDILSSGVFDSRSGLNDSATSFFTRIAQSIFAIALPFMSVFAMTMTTISLISSIIYLTKPDTFDDIDRLHQERRDKKGIKGLIEYGRSAGFRDFILSLCPNFKAYAFNDATQVGADGVPTMQDFLRNIPKYIMIFAFCIVINNRTMLDFIMNGAQVGALVLEHITYDYDYVNSVSSWIDEGSDYKPMSVWDTKTQVGANKLKVYKKIYNILKTRCMEKEDRTTDAKTAMGIKLVDVINGSTFNGVEWDKDLLTISVDYSEVPQGSSVEGVYAVPVSTFLSSDMGVIYASIHTEDILKYNNSYATTTYKEAWTVSDGSTPTAFDLKKVSELANEVQTSMKNFKGTVNCTIQYVDSSGTSQVKTEQVTIGSDGVISQLPSIPNVGIGNINFYRLAPVGSITYETVSSNGNAAEKTLNLNSAITWKNTAYSPTVSNAD